MGLLVFDTDHKEHLLYLVTLPKDVFSEFTRISIEFLKKGINVKVYNAAAQKLGVEPSVVQKSVEGLMYFFMECVKKMATEIDFLDSTLALGFSEEQQKELYSVYKENQTALRQILAVILPEFPSYQNLEWRLDINVASRSLHRQVNPTYLLKLELDQNSPIFLQTDPVNLIHMTNALEEALQELKTQHCRRITRLLK
uniref:COMM domain-containing protein n=1 Tax=Strigamia maritima TaxID=126957 RepID=T1IW03_STRMM